MKPEKLGCSDQTDGSTSGLICSAQSSLGTRKYIASIGQPRSGEQRGRPWEPRNGHFAVPGKAC